MKASFVAGFIVIITIFKELYEYFRSELPLYVNGIYVLLCLILMLGILGTEKFDKYLNSKGVENFGTSLTVGSILIFALENSIFKIKIIRYRRTIHYSEQVAKLILFLPS